MNEIKLKELGVGFVFANYKDACNLLEEDSKCGKGKVYQLKNWKRYFKWDRVKGKYQFVITEIFDIPTEKKIRKYKLDYKQFIISEEDENKNGVYIIRLYNDVYIGSTTVGFRNRFVAHRHHSKNNLSADTKSMVRSDDGTFDWLWIANESEGEYEIREKEAEYINYYIKNTTYSVCNTASPNIKIGGNGKSFKIINQNKSIKIKESDYKKAIELLTTNGIESIE